MDEPDHHKPTPAREVHAKPTPVRSLGVEAPTPAVEADLAEALIEVGERRWTVRVLGRSGRASRASVPLLLLGFWEGDTSDEEPSLEAMVVARSLQELSHEALTTALAGATHPKDPDRKRSFFAGAGQSRRR